MRNAANPVQIALAVVLLGCLAWGLEEVVLGPVDTGDVYPPYSSLRSDPLGAKALYESLAGLPELTVERLYKQRGVFGDPRETMLVLGVDPVAWSTIKEKTLEEYEKLVESGGRLVLAFLPVRPPLGPQTESAVQTRWHVGLKYESGLHEVGSAMPRKTALYFEASPEWRQVAEHNAVERGFGRGSIVLAADTFPLSNEGLREARDAAYIAALVGPSTRVIFDENHFGVVESGSVTKLIRKYRLGGGVAMLALVAGLFLWRSSSSFLPPRDATPAGVVDGRDSIQGMTALLHRGVAEKDLADACFAEWSKSAPRGERSARVEEEIRRWGGRDPVEAYRAAARVLTEKK